MSSGSKPPVAEQSPLALLAERIDQTDQNMLDHQGAFDVAWDDHGKATEQAAEAEEARKRAEAALLDHQVDESVLALEAISAAAGIVGYENAPGVPATGTPPRARGRRAREARPLPRTSHGSGLHPREYHTGLKATTSRARRLGNWAMRKLRLSDPLIEATKHRPAVKSYHGEHADEDTPKKPLKQRAKEYWTWPESHERTGDHPKKTPVEKAVRALSVREKSRKHFEEGSFHYPSQGPLSAAEAVGLAAERIRLNLRVIISPETEQPIREQVNLTSLRQRALEHPRFNDEGRLAAPDSSDPTSENFLQAHGALKSLATWTRSHIDDVHAQIKDGDRAYLSDHEKQEFILNVEKLLGMVAMNGAVEARLSGDEVKEMMDSTAEQTAKAARIRDVDALDPDTYFRLSQIANEEQLLARYPGAKDILGRIQSHYKWLGFDVKTEKDNVVVEDGKVVVEDGTRLSQIITAQKLRENPKDPDALSALNAFNQTRAEKQAEVDKLEGDLDEYKALREDLFAGQLMLRTNEQRKFGTRVKKVMGNTRQARKATFSHMDEAERWQTERDVQVRNAKSADKRMYDHTVAINSLIDTAEDLQEKLEEEKQKA